jgi:hypothetical protein
MIQLTSPVGRVLIDENRISAVSEENAESQIPCRVWVGDTMTEDSGFNIMETYDEVLKIIKDNTEVSRK